MRQQQFKVFFFVCGTQSRETAAPPLRAGRCNAPVSHATACEGDLLPSTGQMHSSAPGLGFKRVVCNF